MSCIKISRDNNKIGYTLVELSISLTIIALILAGVTGYTTLIRQSEVKSVIADFQNYKLIYQNFHKNYKQIPGDMPNATDYWTTDCADVLTCNGDGDGVVEAIWSSSSDETARAWKHLNLSGYMTYHIDIIPSDYTGSLTIKSLAPPGKIEASGFYIASGSDIGGSSGAVTIPSPWTDNITNALFFGANMSGEANPNGLTQGVLNAKEAWSIDLKIDDASNSGSGNDTGEVRTIEDENGATNCINSGYNLQNDTKSCLIGFQLDENK